MPTKRNFCKEAVHEIERQLMREDTDGAECCLHIRNVLSELHRLETGYQGEYHYLKGPEVK